MNVVSAYVWCGPLGVPSHETPISPTMITRMANMGNMDAIVLKGSVDVVQRSSVLCCAVGQLRVATLTQCDT